MKIIVTGANGQLGHDLVAELSKRGHQVIGTDINTEAFPLDITDSNKVNAFIDSIQPDVVIHCAAWTNVDAAEDPANYDTVRAINVSGTKNVAGACAMAGAKIVYISTDYVFDGSGTEPRTPDCKDFAPLNVYGRSKLDGELAVQEATEKFCIVRTQWVFGRNGNNFVKTMARLAETHSSLKVVSDQFGLPTYTPDLAHAIANLVETDNFGFYHLTNSGDYISWNDFAQAIMSALNKDVAIEGCTTAEYGAKANRPLNGRIAQPNSLGGLLDMPGWQSALKRYIESGL